MEPFLADFINSKKIPKFIRYFIVIILCSFIIFLGIECFICSEMLIGNIFGILLAVLSILSCIYLINKIYKQ